MQFYATTIIVVISSLIYNHCSSLCTEEFQVYMAIYLRTKRAMDLLDDDAKARLRDSGCSDSSSGSEHEPLSCLLHDFFMNGDDSTDPGPRVGVADDFSDDDNIGHEMERTVEEIRELQNARDGDGDLYRLRLVAHVIETLAILRSDASAYRRAVMVRLREDGYDAGLCKAKWQGSTKLVGGNYEYIDVVVAAAAHGERRYIIDLAFAAEFEVARASAEYCQVVAALPELMVLLAEDVRQLVRIAARAARRSLKSRDLHVPPWRKERYMVAKWLGPYRRTIKAIPASSAGVPSAGADGRTIYRASRFPAMTADVRRPAARIR